MKTFPADLPFENAGWINRERIIRITEDYGALTECGFVVIPKGFLSDGGSVPRSLWSIIDHPFTGWLPASGVHDFLYRKDNGYDISRAEADMILRTLMESLGYSWAKRWAVWSGVRAGGWKSWQKKGLNL